MPLEFEKRRLQRRYQAQLLQWFIGCGIDNQERVHTRAVGTFTHERYYYMRSPPRRKLSKRGEFCQVRIVLRCLCDQS